MTEKFFKVLGDIPGNGREAGWMARLLSRGKYGRRAVLAGRPPSAGKVVCGRPPMALPIAANGERRGGSSGFAGQDALEEFDGTGCGDPVGLVDGRSLGAACRAPYEPLAPGATQLVDHGAAFAGVPDDADRGRTV
ncbi:hypothetical protein Mth01_26770 [Sphaerimonospora thailandensis]|uniref:Uncharacterized protein n=1 Tax=Sphaerimonospora thailandensis TaxID=795644 RepID=A0A8J3R9B3_9ACTN|nr:hypothetical protein Mth01_26770 [Sphaerimonospora thailandensis]